MLPVFNGVNVRVCRDVAEFEVVRLIVWLQLSALEQIVHRRGFESKIACPEAAVVEFRASQVEYLFV